MVKNAKGTDAQKTTLTALYIEYKPSEGGSSSGETYDIAFTSSMAIAAGTGRITVTPTITATAPAQASDMNGTITYKVMMLNPINGNADLQYTKEVTLTANDASAQALELAVTATGFYKVEWTITVNGAAPQTGTTTLVEVTALS